MRCSFLAAAAILVAAAITGCSSSPPPIVPAEGTVLLDGEPLPGVVVQFVPTIQGPGADFIATGTTDEKGHFQLTCNGQPGACACETIVLIHDAPMPEGVRGNQNAEAAHLAGLKNRPIPSKYFNTTKNPLKIQVTPGQSEYKLELQR